jgi:hypothetical protein
MGHATIDYKDILTGDHLATLTELDVGVHGEKVTAHAQPDFLHHAKTYFFLFWNPPGRPLTTEKKIEVKLHPGSEATAWYGLKGGSGIHTSAFSDGEDTTLTQTPIASVDPASAWTGGNSETVSNQGKVTITAKESIGDDSAETFDGWLLFGDGVASGASLNVPAGGTCYAVASYRNHKVKIQTTNRSALAYTRLLPGVAVDGAGEPQPPEPLASLAPADRDLVLGLSLNEIGRLVNDTAAGSAIRKAGLDLAGEALKKLAATAAKE